MLRWRAVLWVQGGRRRGGILFFLANFSEFSSKAHHPLGEFSQKFSPKLSPNFHQLSPNFHQKGQKGVKNGLTFTFSFTSFHPSPFFLAALKDSPTFAPSVETNEAR